MRLLFVQRDLTGVKQYMEKRLKSQKLWWDPEKSLGENPARDLDLEDAMMSLGEDEKQPEGEKQKMDEDVGYSKVYTKNTWKVCREKYV